MMGSIKLYSGLTILHKLPTLEVSCERLDAECTLYTLVRKQYNPRLMQSALRLCATCCEIVRIGLSGVLELQAVQFDSEQAMVWVRGFRPSRIPKALVHSALEVQHYFVLVEGEHILGADAIEQTLWTQVKERIIQSSPLQLHALPTTTN